MKAAPLKVRPRFALMKQTDEYSSVYMQVPRWLFTDSRYVKMSQDAKLAYMLLLDRFKLSSINGWVNEEGEVFVVYPRRKLAEALGISEKRVTAAFRLLAEHHLVWESRRGRGAPNQIYLAKVEHTEGHIPGKAAQTDSHAVPREEVRTESAETAVPEPSNPPFKNRRDDCSRTAVSAVLEPPNWRPNKNKINNNKHSQNKFSQSVSQKEEEPRAGGRAFNGTDRRTDRQNEEERELSEILDSCELFIYPPKKAKVFESAIERLFYTESYRIGNAVLPQSRVRSRLHQLDGIVMQNAAAKLEDNTEREVANSTGYIMATIFNTIAESEGDLIVDPYLNSLHKLPNRAVSGEGPDRSGGIASNPMP